MGNTKHMGFFKGRKNPVRLRRGVTASRCPRTTSPDICPWHQLTFRRPFSPGVYGALPKAGPGKVH